MGLASGDRLESFVPKLVFQFVDDRAAIVYLQQKATGIRFPGRRRRISGDGRYIVG